MLALSLQPPPRLRPNRMGVASIRRLLWGVCAGLFAVGQLAATALAGN